MKQIPDAPTLVDLFCGCGGFSLGAHQAGFSSVLAVDIDEVLQSAYRRNFARANAVLADASALDGAAWRHLLNGIRPDGLIGGPPCQGFSRIGRRQKDDPRNTLVHHFYRHVDLLKPKFFVMENVEGILDGANAEILASAIETVSGRYRILGPLVVDASACGAATVRRRVVVVGWDPDEMAAIAPEDLVPKNIPAVNVRDAIADLPGPLPPSGSRKDFGWAKYPPRRTPSPYAAALRAMPGPGLGCEESIKRLKDGYVSGLAGTLHNEEVEERYARVLPGRVENVGKSYRLTWEGRCPTLRAGTSMAHGAFQAVRPLHPSEPRVITVREAARLQSFPDFFTFHNAKWHSFRMIGNSVSPLLGKFIMSAVAARLDLRRAA